MSMSTSLLAFIIKDVQSTLISVLIGLITIAVLYLLKFYFVTLSKYPKGPVPWPILGNVLSKN